MSDMEQLLELGERLRQYQARIQELEIDVVDVNQLRAEAVADLSACRQEREVLRQMLDLGPVAALIKRAESAEALLSTAQDTIQVLTQRAVSAEAKNVRLEEECDTKEAKGVRLLHDYEALYDNNTQLAAQVAGMIGWLEDVFPASQTSGQWIDYHLITGQQASGLIALRTTAPAEAEKLVRLVAVVDELLVWDKKYPKGQEFQVGLSRRIERELDEIVGKLRDLRGVKV